MKGCMKMKKVISLLHIFCCIFFLAACCVKNSTQISVELKPMEQDSVPVSAAPSSGADNSAVRKQSLPVSISCAINFTPEQTREMSNFSNGGLYYADEFLYGRLYPVSGSYLRMGTVELNDDGEPVTSGTAVFLDGDVSPSYMCRYDDSLYYVRKDNSEVLYSIARIFTDGTGLQVLYEGADCNYLQIHNERLYFTNADHLFVSTDMNGDDIHIIIDKEVFFPYFIDKYWILYQDDADTESLHLFNIDSRYDIKLNDMQSYVPVITGSELFYLGVPDGEENYHICHMDLSGIELEAEDGITEYVLGREVETGEMDVYTLFTDGEYIYGANNTVASIDDWRSFTDGGYLYLSENCCYLHDGWALGYQLNSNGAVKNILLRSISANAVSVLPRVYG